MYVEQLYTGCLSEAAYYIESNGEAAVIDPMRDIEAYLELAKNRNAKIKYIFETHFHADFISGHLDLSKATGAPIIYGPETEAGFKVHIAADGEKFTLGNCTVQVLHTPGHTLESSCYLLKDETGRDYALFTGDTLFIGDVGRPDLAQKGAETTSAELAAMLYDSLENKIKPLAGDVLVYPAHGAGSSCGKNLSTKTVSTIEEQKQTNYALLQPSKEEFIKAVTEGLSEPPQYFPVNAEINKAGYAALDKVLENALTALSVEEFENAMNMPDVLIIDTRNQTAFVQGFIPESIFIGLDGRFAEWAGSLIDFNKKILILGELGTERETAIRLARVGFDKMTGYLNGGFEAWKNADKPIDMIIEVEADELEIDLRFDEQAIVIDVRKETEYADGHVKDAANIPLATLTDPATMSPFEDTDNIYVHCQSGYRSTIAASLLKRQGIHNLRNVAGGWQAIEQIKEIKKEKSVAALN
ncbi:MAG: rhodanese-like domain-containing protein [Arachidicoccus sp.]|nr:rhodanese-like domain-containing protein [Arachidicoccus sp.]